MTQPNPSYSQTVGLNNHSTNPLCSQEPNVNTNDDPPPRDEPSATVAPPSPPPAGTTSDPPGKDPHTMQPRPAPGRDLRNRLSTLRGQAQGLDADIRWARIAVREHRRATFWRALLDQYIESLEREASERKEKGNDPRH